MLKPKKYDWKDSNIAFGSDLDKSLKKEAAEAREPAWAGSGETVGMEIFRVVKYKIQKWPVEDYGKFYAGDSYIILNTYKNPDEDDLEYDLHFWIGKYSTQDEYGTAAYKTAELDTFHDDKPRQHREVQGHESPLFSSYFPNGINYLKGGADTGFRHVKPEEYRPRLFQFVGTTVIKEVGLYKQSLNTEDVFVLDKGLTIIQINTSNCDKDEMVKAKHHCLRLKDDRCGLPKITTYDPDSDLNSDISGTLADMPDKSKPKAEVVAPGPHTKALMKVSDEGGKAKMTPVECGGAIDQEMLDPNDVFILDLEKVVYIWVGDNASAEEKKNGMSYGHSYVAGTDRPLRSICVVNQRRAHQCYKDMKA